MANTPISIATPIHSPRRSASMPITPRMGLTSISISNPLHPHAPILPLSSSASPPSSARKFRSTSRRLSYGIKSRMGRYAYPISVSALLAMIFLVYTWSNSTSSPHRISRTNGGKLHLYTRNQHPLVKSPPVAAKGKGKGKGKAVSDNGVSLLTQTEDELIAEDDLFWQAYIEPEPLTPEEAAAQQELAAHREDVLEQDKQHSISALIWWLAEGGIIPRSYVLPSKKELNKMGGRGLERILDDLESGFGEESIYPEGWADYAKKQYKVVLFSKSYCPFSKKAKTILENYRLTPAPFIIELDRRSDMDQIQTLLQRLTGRRTVPNIFLNFQSIGGSDELTLLHAEGGLQRKFEEMAVLPGYRYRASPPRILQPVQPVHERKGNQPPADLGTLPDITPQFDDGASGPVFVEDFDEPTSLYEDDLYADDQDQNDLDSDDQYLYGDDQYGDDQYEDEYEESDEPDFKDGTEPEYEESGGPEIVEDESELEADPDAPFDFKAAIKAAHEKLDYVQGMGAWDEYEPLDVDPHDELDEKHQVWKNAFGQTIPKGQLEAKKAKTPNNKKQPKVNRLVGEDNKRIVEVVPAQQAVVKDIPKVKEDLKPKGQAEVVIKAVKPVEAKNDKAAAGVIETVPEDMADMDTPTQVEALSVDETTPKLETVPVIESESDELARLRARLAELEALAAKGAGGLSLEVPEKVIDEVLVVETPEVADDQSESKDKLTGDRHRGTTAEVEVDAGIEPPTPVKVEVVKPDTQIDSTDSTEPKIKALVVEAQPAVAPPIDAKARAKALEAKLIDDRQAKVAAARAKTREENQQRIDQARARIAAAKAEKEAAAAAAVQIKNKVVVNAKAAVPKKAKVAAAAKAQVKGQGQAKVIKQQDVVFQKAPQPRYPQKNGAAALAAAAKMRRVPVKKGKVVG